MLGTEPRAVKPAGDLVPAFAKMDNRDGNDRHLLRDQMERR
jgi:hypothetical protein